MMKDRHVVLRLALNALVPVVLTLAALNAARTGSGLGGPVASAWLLALAGALHALVFGFTASRRRAPPALSAALAAVAFLSLCAAIAVFLAVAAPGGLEPPAAGPAARRMGALLVGAAALVATALATLSMLTAIGARPRPLTIEDP